MKATLDIPDELASEVQRLAELSGRGSSEQLLRLVYLALLVEELPLADLAAVASQLSAIRAVRNKLMHGMHEKRASSPTISISAKTGLPVIHSPSDAPICSMTADQFQALIHESELEGDVERAGLTPRH